MSEFWDILIYVCASIVVVLVALLITKKVAKPVDVKSSADFLLATVTIIGTLVSVILGLLVSTSVERYREMESCVDAEGTKVADVFRLARGLPKDKASTVQSLCVDYCDKASSDEWPAMKMGRMSNALTLTYGKLNDAIVSLHPVDVSQSNLQMALIDLSCELAEKRRARIVFVQSRWMQRLLPVLIVSCLIVLAITFTYVDRKPTKLQAILVALVAVALSSNIGVIILLSRPFDGSWNIKPDVFETNAEYMRRFLNMPLSTGVEPQK